jgi:hypothetical protein
MPQLPPNAAGAPIAMSASGESGKHLPDQSITESDSWRTSVESRARQLPASRARQVHLLPPVFFVTP